MSQSCRHILEAAQSKAPCDRASRGRRGRTRGTLYFRACFIPGELGDLPGPIRSSPDRDLAHELEQKQILHTRSIGRRALRIERCINVLRRSGCLRSETTVASFSACLQGMLRTCFDGASSSSSWVCCLHESVSRGACHPRL